MKKISIVVPAYNEEKTLDQVLKKLLNLSLPGYEKEIIVVNDASSDGTNEILSKYRNKIKVRHHDKNSATVVVDKTHRVIMEKLRASCAKPELVDLYSDLTSGADITAKLLAMVAEHVDAKGQTYIDLLTPEPVEVSAAA
jgi:cellulose synthase/poly-beta-1,6-N-acetylglucosamine synthase-like glycosyltransferase